MLVLLLRCRLLSSERHFGAHGIRGEGQVHIVTAAFLELVNILTASVGRNVFGWFVGVDYLTGALHVLQLQLLPLERIEPQFKSRCCRTLRVSDLETSVY